jgi:eukaryotic-like serine/threonine-protein kinase
METTVEDLCNVMSRCQFLPAEQIRDLRQRWSLEAGNAAGRVDRFAAWLVSRGVATEFQVGVLSRGNGSQLFVGPYRLLERVGRGRLAGVYKATHTSGAVVGVKILPPSKAAQPLLLARFQRELELAVSVRHPNVIRSYHGGEIKGLHYLVMEHLEGETLEDALARRKRLPTQEGVGLVHQALLGLQAIHEQGLVHRDLRPGNLMLVGGQPNSAAEATVKILDLGMGRALFDDGEGSPGFDLTRPGEMLGSSDCMSPEQAKDAHNIDIRSDIYALGCVLYHTLAGEPPFADVSPVRQLLRHATEEPRPITQHNPEVPSGLMQVLAWMLAKDPAKRYPTPARAAQALEMFLAANSSPSRPTDASLNVYLAWVDSMDGGRPAPAPVPPPPATRPKNPAPPGKPAPLPTGVNVLPAGGYADVEVVKVMGVADIPPPPPRNPPPQPPLRTRRDDEDERPAAKKGRRAERDEEEEERPAAKKERRAERDDEEEEESPQVLGMTGRELKILIIGLVSIVGLAVLGLLVWLVLKLVR